MRLIDADALKAWFFRPYSNEETYSNIDIGLRIDIASTVDPVRHGCWSLNPYNKEWDVCSVCRTGTKRREYGINPDGSEYVTEYSYRYCPNCGAKMEVDLISWALERANSILTSERKKEEEDENK